MSSEKDYSVLPEVIVIQESAKIKSEEHKPKKLRVCAYARVSTEKEEQEYSFENQRDYYVEYISKRSDWEFVGIYSDFGLSGKNKNRPQFIKMIDDCHAGKIDRIITKSISRFARNTIDCIQTVRELREKDIGVYFEREGIDSLSPQSALVLSIMAIVAEEESRSISNNIKWAIQKQFAKGHYLIHTKHFLGYSREEDNRIIIISKQALAVRSIYQLYLDGKSIHQIALEMELREIESPEGNKNWGDSTVLSILQNEKYKGDCLLQKTYSPDFLASKRYKNTGQLRSYYVKSHHAPIVSSTMFDEVQNEMQRRKDLRTGSKAYPSKYSGKSCLSGLLICGQCGGIMRRHIQYRKEGGIGYWVCQRHDQGCCSMMQIKEKVINDGIQMVIRQILYQRETLYTEMTNTIIDAARKAHKSSLKSVNAKIKRVQRQIQQIKDDYIEYAITYDTYCRLSRQFIHTEPFLELEREEEFGVSNDEQHRIRTTFYQDYTNTDFVGQIIPKVKEDKSVTYEFNPGPFALAMKMAIERPNEPVALVIEELNRGNAASIFGDIFQLLDRTEEGKSQYKITNVNLQDYLNKVFKDKNIHFDYIVIPSNLYIVATMNTSDQNVFTLDTAFKRRWKFEKLPNVFAKDHKYAEYYVPGMTGVTWRHLVDSINRYIVKNADELSSEDKQLGVYFIGKETLCKEQTGETDVVKKKEFAYKLLEYLWDDVAKYNHVDWFGPDIKTLDQLIVEYMEKGQKVFIDGILG